MHTGAKTPRPLSDKFLPITSTEKSKLIMFVFVLQGARGNDGAAGAAGPPVSLLFSKKNKKNNNDLFSCSRCEGVGCRKTLSLIFLFPRCLPQGPTGPAGPAGFPGGPGAKVTEHSTSTKCFYQQTLLLYCIVLYHIFSSQQSSTVFNAIQLISFALPMGCYIELNELIEVIKSRNPISFSKVGHPYKSLHQCQK